MNVDDLERHLHDRSDATHLGQSPVQTIMRRGSRRRARRRTLATAGMLAVCAVGAVTTVQVLARGSEPARIGSTPVGTGPAATDTEAPASTTPAPASLAPTGDVTLVDSPLVWNTVEVGSAESVGAFYGLGLDRFDGPPFLAVSTQPGRSNNGQPTLYRSDDALRWSAVGPLDPASGSLTSEGDALYRVSTMASAADLTGAQPHLHRSTDGTTWTTHDLPYDLTALHEPGISSVSVTGGDVAQVGDELLVSAVVRPSVTPASIAAVLGVDARQIANQEGGGIIVYAEAEPVTCAELDAENERVNKDVSPETTVVIAADGATVATEPAPDDASPPVTYRSVGGGDGKTCWLWGDESARDNWADLGFSPTVLDALAGIPMLFRSTDGATFQQVDLPPSLASADTLSVGTIGDDYLIAGTSYDTTNMSTAVVHGRPDSGWQDLPAATGMNDPVTHIGAVADTPVLASWSTVSTLHGDQWLPAPVSALTAPQTPTAWQYAAAGERGIVIAAQIGDLVDPNVRDHPDQPWEFVDGSQHWVVYFSPDGVTWSATELSELIGDVGTKQVSAVQVTADQVLVSVREPVSTNPDDPLPDTTVLVGTLA